MRVERLDHIHVYVKDLERAKDRMASVLGLRFSTNVCDESLGMRVAFSPVGLELIEPTSSESIVNKAIQSRGEGVAALSFKVSDIEVAIAELQSLGMRLVGRVDYPHLKEAQFHPRDCLGIMIELCQYDEQHPVFYAAGGG